MLDHSPVRWGAMISCGGLLLAASGCEVLFDPSQKYVGPSSTQSSSAGSSASSSVTSSSGGSSGAASSSGGSGSSSAGSSGGSSSGATASSGTSSSSSGQACGDATFTGFAAATGAGQAAPVDIWGTGLTGAGVTFEDVPAYVVPVSDREVVAFISGNLGESGHISVEIGDGGCVLTSPRDYEVWSAALTWADAGTFAAPGTGNFAAMVAADLQGDGRTELVATSFGTGQLALLALGPDAGLTTGVIAVEDAGQGEVWGLAAGDLRGTGRSDLVTTGRSTGTVTVLLNQGDGGFAATSHRVGPTAIGVAIGDLNGDGTPDLAACTQSTDGGGAVKVLLGEGDGGFGPGPEVSVGGSNAYEVAVADLRADGSGELLVTVGYADGGAVVECDPLVDGGFTAPVLLYPALPAQIAVADLEGTGYPDLVLVTGGVAIASRGQVVVMRNQGDGGFGAPMGYAAGTDPISVAVADANGDGALDIVAGDYASGAAVILLGADGGFAPTPGLSFGLAPGAVVVADITGDGLPDLIGASDLFAVLQGEEHAYYLDSFSPPAGGVRSAVALRGNDLDAISGVSFVVDGGEESLMAPTTFRVVTDSLILATVPPGAITGPIVMLAGTVADVSPDPFIVWAPTEVWSEPRAYPNPATSAALAVGDLRGDGVLDVLTADLEDGGGNLFVLASIGDGGLGNAESLTNDVTAACLVAAASRHEPQLEVVAPGPFGLVAIDEVAGGPPTVDTPELAFKASAVAAGDVSGDGRLEYVAVGPGDAGPGLVSIVSEGTQSGGISFEVPPNPVSVALGDLRGSGMLDVVTSSVSPPGIGVALDEGDAGFSVGFVDAGASQVALADVNGDGLPDLVALLDTADGIWLATNLGDGGFAPFALVAAGVSDGGGPTHFAVADVTGDGQPDVVTCSASGAVSVLVGDRGAFALDSALAADGGALSAGTDPTGVAVADIDQDGHADIITVNASGTVSVFLGR